MSDDAVPTPPASNGLPPSTFPCAMLPVSWLIVPMDQRTATGEKIWALVLDTPTGRHVTIYTQADLAKMRDSLNRALGSGLTVAAEEDLRRLRDAAPFERPPA